MHLPGSELARVVRLAEKDLAVQEWQFSGVDLWPIIRLSLYEAHDSGSDNKLAVDNQIRKNIKITQRIADIGNRLRKIVTEMLITRRDAGHEDRRLRRADVLFLTYPEARQFVKGAGWFDRFSDPILQELEKQGCSTLVWEICLNNEYRIPRHRRSAFIQRALEFHSLRMRWQNRRPFPAQHIQRYLKFLTWLDVTSKWVQAPSPENLLSRARFIRQKADLFRRWLSHVQPRLAIVNSYYDDMIMSFILACKELQVPSVDLQHGVQGHGKLAYAPFLAIPEKGYNTIPDRFWVWSDYEASTINEWKRHHPSQHAAVIGGNPWIAYWRGSGVFAGLYDEELQKLKSRWQGNKYLLVTLQTEPDFLERVEWILTFAAKAPKSWIWLLRLHPCMLKEESRITAVVGASGLQNVSVKEATSLPLPAILGFTDIHITAWSAVVLEAEQFGVPSIFWDASGEKHFKAQITRGVAAPFYSEGQFFELIQKYSQSHHASRDGFATAERPNQHKDVLMELIRNTGLMEVANGFQKIY